MSLGWIGDYELLRELDSGGMGVVYVARHRELGREVALKRIDAREAFDEVTAARLRKEAQAVAQLRHPNLVAVHAVGEHQGSPYYVMDLVEGESLKVSLRGGPLPVAQAVAVAVAIAEALQHAHEQGIVHRDVKPANVLMRPDGRPMLIDFGLLRELSEQRERLTRTGEILGTPAYMAPEQANGDLARIGPATDVYGLGATLYAMLSGQAPFRGATLSVLNAVLLEAAPPLGLPPADAGIEAICLRCLNKDAASRYGSMQELAEDLRRFERGEWVAAPRPGKVWTVLAAAGVALILGAVAWALQAPAQPPAPVAPAPSPPPAGTQPVEGPSQPVRPATFELELLREVAHASCRRARFVPGGLLTAGSGGVKLWSSHGRVEGNPFTMEGLLGNTETLACVGRDGFVVGGEGWLAVSPLRPGVGPAPMRWSAQGSASRMEAWREERFAFLTTEGVYVYDLKTRKPAWSKLIPKLRCITFDPEGDLLAIDEELTIRRWSGAAGRAQVVARIRTDQPSLFVSDGAGGWLIGDKAGALTWFDERFAVRMRLDGGIKPDPFMAKDARRAHKRTVRAVRLLPGGRFVSLSSGDFAIWSAEGELLTRQEGVVKPPWMAVDLDVSPAGDRLLIAIKDQGAQLWSISR